MKNNLKTLALIPYFGGISRAANSNKFKRMGYLTQTIDRLKSFTKDLVITVSNKEDQLALENNNVKENIILVECDPIFLPAESVSLIKSFDFDNIYYTEADQKLYCDTWDEINHYVYKENVFLIPKRMFIEREFPEIVLTSHARKNESKKNLKDKMHKNFFIENDRFFAFGGAWLTSKRMFEKVNFRKSHYMPIEHTSCFDLYDCGQGNIILTKDPFSFWVIHLSGNESRNQTDGQGWATSTKLL